jgi:hypothetical protein
MHVVQGFDIWHLGVLQEAGGASGGATEGKQAGGSERPVYNISARTA